MGLFSTGYEANQKEVEKQEQEKKNRGKKLFNYFLPKPEGGKSVEGNLIFLTEKPMNFRKHQISKFKNGKEVWETYVCTEDDKCPFCNNGDRATYNGAFLVIDETPYTDKNGNKHEMNLKTFFYGTRVVSQLERISEKYGLASRECTIVRNGSGTQTTYIIEKGDKVDLEPEEIRDLLPEAIREDFNGTEESLYKILEEQLTMLFPENAVIDDGEEESVSDDSDSIIGVDDEEEEEKPKKKTTGKKTLFKSKK